MRIFLDTNVLVSAVATRGLCADVVREVLVSHLLIISESLLTEVRSVLRKKLAVPNDLISEFIDLLKRDNPFSTHSPLHEIDIQDNNDVVILSSALNGNADLFITGDKELLELHKVKNMNIVSPRMFWEKLLSNSPDKL